MSYTNKALHIDLTSGKIELVATDQKLREKYIGGKGMGFAMMEQYAPDPDPMGTENPLIFINGPFTGTKVQTSARTVLVTKSPLTNSLLDSNCGGSFGPRLKMAGYDYLMVTGRSPKPVYLYINEDDINIMDASELWGKGIFETNDILLQRHPGHDPRVAAIGQAGENLLRIACVGVDKHRQFGRGGAGAVMGSKMLKAIVVDGNIPVKYFDEEKFTEVNKRFTRDIMDNGGIKYRRQKGTMKCVRSGQDYEILPVKNFQEVTFDDWEKLSSETSREELNWEDTACFNCSIRCSKWARWDGHEIEGPEFETTAFLGINSMVNDIKDVSWANELCNDWGMDTISAGVTTAFAMECYEKGLLKKWNGMSIDWGDAKAQRKLLESMVKREGAGALFADGTKAAAEKIGQGSEYFAIHTYGMELSGVNPKGSLTMALVFAVADFASHTRLWMTEVEMGEDFSIEDVPGAVAEGLDTINTRNSLPICDFVPLGLDRIAEVLNAATGTSHTEKSLLKTGEDISTLARTYNMRNGRKHTHDTIPERFFEEKSLSGFMRDQKISREYFNALVQKYYKLRGWNEKGEVLAKDVV
ncbi:MAG: aldehyde ferredoxin oxidoreductase family protein [Bacteroidota bacterium]|nr:aldehyde ferredoxin oxidoreductase family protein [Bacteroidota bacterium]